MRGRRCSRADVVALDTWCAAQVTPYFLHSEQALRASFFRFRTSRGELVKAKKTPFRDGGVWTAEVNTIEDFGSSLSYTVQTAADFVAKSALPCHCRRSALKHTFNFECPNSHLHCVALLPSIILLCMWHGARGVT